MCLRKLARKLRLFYEPTNFFGRAASPNKKATESVAFLLGLRRATSGSLFAHTCAPASRRLGTLRALRIPLAKTSVFLQ
jgi:hypothetical protein